MGVERSGLYLNNRRRGYCGLKIGHDSSISRCIDLSLWPGRGSTRGMGGVASRCPRLQSEVITTAASRRPA